MHTDALYDTQQTWDAIAESFDLTRRAPWKQCIDFINNLKETDIVADCGCGNGRHLLPAAAHCSKAFGIDLSKKLLTLVQRKVTEKNINNITLLHGNMVHLPFRDDSLDVILCIASLHNVKGRTNRQAAIREIYRILKPQGTALVSVWSRWQDRYRTYFLKQFFRQSCEFGDITIYWRQHGLDIPRFYHLYSKNEFVQELRGQGFTIEHMEDARFHSKRFPDNYFATVRKKII
jgi:ubiquinone/menaquinone biosynthesis C-methylase UbiE